MQVPPGLRPIPILRIWLPMPKQDVMKVFYPNTAEKKNYLVESLNSGRMKYTDAKKELTPTLQAG